MKTLKVLLIIVLILIVLPLLSYLTWYLKQGSTIDVLVINKSMTNFKDSENKAFNYVLNANKVVLVGHHSYDLKADYMGLHMNKKDYEIKYPRLKDIERTAEKSELIYYADAAGIRVSQLRGLKDGEADLIEYGGLNNTDYTLIRELISKEKFLVVESAFFGAPTDQLVRYNIEKLIDIYYVGWIGKYVNKLEAVEKDNERIKWKTLYKEFTGVDPVQQGPGIVFINQEAKRIYVLEEGKDFENAEGLIVSSESGINRFNLPKRTDYFGWFSVVYPGENEVLSNFELHPSESGRVRLNEAGLPDTFPALIMAEDNFLFLAGDFGKSKVNSSLSKLEGFRSLFEAIKRRSSKASNFFYTYYEPLMDALVKETIEVHVEHD